ncbi:unnamed protein product [Acanthoscelides obtectus]|uniref:C2H2-type domain-containing protein n=1 Tax=Acanthoscelides obtectus TaxID=200917 RepID=A0A9P0K5E9_ACAOB|nr:unnamed protein product [Acanthoscelides obtectus]CAK1666455.1 Zinc finger protein 711 [Acanthoscelides obtectus]
METKKEFETVSMKRETIDAEPSCDSSLPANMSIELKVKIEKEDDLQIETNTADNYLDGGEMKNIRVKRDTLDIENKNPLLDSIKWDQDEKYDLLTDREKSIDEIKSETYMEVDKIEHMDSPDIIQLSDLKKAGDTSLDMSCDTTLNSYVKKEIWEQHQQAVHEMDHSDSSSYYHTDFNPYDYQSHFLADVSNEEHYQTTSEANSDTDMFQSKTIGSDNILTCIHCNATYRSKQTKDDHIVRKHPEFISTISSKIHECASCHYRTTIKALYIKHVLKHPEMASSLKFSTCIHCNASFKSKIELDEHTLKKHPANIASVTSKVHECTDCTYKTTMKKQLDTHMLKHLNSVDRTYVCIYCEMMFKSKQMLDDHIIKKHPDFVSSITSKIHECNICDFKTTMKSQLVRHMLKHPGSVESHTFNYCKHCGVRFKSKTGLDEHTIRKHPEFVSTITSKIHECTDCSFKTTISSQIVKHISKHPEMADSYRGNSCLHCGAIFDGKQVLDDHIIKKHPEFASSVSRQIYDCPKCSYKSTIRSRLDKHFLQHPDLETSFKLSTCEHCNSTFKSKTSLDEHTLRKHPYFIESISSKIHECSKCSYKTTMTSQLSRHMLKHPDAVDGFKNTCMHCNTTFESKQTLDDHILKKHPKFIESISGKIYECTNCPYKTTIKSRLAKHMLNHPEAAGSYKLSPCPHCNTTFKSKQTVDDHVLKKHPEYITSISSKIHECPNCEYKSTSKSLFDKHLLKHPEIIGSYNASCQHCDARYHSKTALDDHVIKKHPEFDATVTSKIHVCPTCGYRTCAKSNLDKHISSKHR